MLPHERGKRGHDSLARRAATTYLPVAGHVVESVGRGPDPPIVLRQFIEIVGRCLFDHVFGHGNDITALVRLIVEHRPRYGRVLLADSQHPAEAECGEHDMVGFLIEDHVLDGANFVTRGVVDGRALHLGREDSFRVAACGGHDYLLVADYVLITSIPNPLFRLPFARILSAAMTQLRKEPIEAT